MNIKHVHVQSAPKIKNILVSTRDADGAGKHECARRKRNPTTGVQCQCMANI